MYRKTIRISVQLDLARMPSEKKLTLANAVYSRMKHTPAYPDPPVDLELFKAEIDSFAAALAATADGGGELSPKRTARKKFLAGCCAIWPATSSPCVTATSPHSCPADSRRVPAIERNRRPSRNRSAKSWMVKTAVQRCSGLS